MYLVATAVKSQDFEIRKLKEPFLLLAFPLENGARWRSVPGVAADDVEITLEGEGVFAKRGGVRYFQVDQKSSESWWQYAEGIGLVGYGRKDKEGQSSVIL